eukprot:gene15639-15786_t
MSVKTHARERLLKAAEELFYAEGIGATGIAAITARAHVAKMSLYNNFASKAELVDAYIHGRCQDWDALYQQRLISTATPQERILAVFDSYIDHAERAYEWGFRGCGLLNAAAELPVGHPARSLVAGQKEKAEQLFREHLSAMQLAAGASIEAIAEHLSFILEGAMARAGLEGNDTRLKAARKLARLSAAAVLVLLEAALVVSWSAGFVGTRFASDHAPIFCILLWRSLVSGFILLPLALTFGPAIRWKDAVAQMLFGALAMAGYLASFALAIGYGVPTGLVALMTDMLPLVVALLSWPVLGLVLTNRQWFGTSIGLAGVLIAAGWSNTLTTAPLWAYILPVIGTSLLALGILLQKRGSIGLMPIYQSLCIQCLSAAVVFGLFAWRDGGIVPQFEVNFIGGILWLVFVATFGAWGLYYIALRKSSPARVTAVLYLSPAVTMIWAWMLFGEPLSWAMAAGLIISLIGIVIVAR